MTDSGSMRLNGGDLITAGDRVPHVTAAGTFWTDVLADGTTFGNSEPLVRAINTLMTQGSWETLGPFGNRAPAIVVEIEGENADALNAGEVWLSSLMNPGALEWLPPGQTVWTVFDVIWCHINRSEDERWDLDENVWKRRYVIPIKSLPHARSADLTTTPAVDSTTDVVVTDGSSASGWAGARYPAVGFSGTPTVLAPAVVSGAVRVTSSGTTGAGFLAAEYTFGSAIPSDTPYLRVDARSYNSLLANAPTYFKIGGSWVYVAPASRVSATTGTNLYSSTSYYTVPAGATAIRMSSSITGVKTSPYLEVDQIRRLSRLPASSTNRQKLVSLYPGGSAPAAGSLHVSHPSAALGKTIVHTYPAGRPSPALMQYWLSGAVTPTTDAAAINGRRIDFTVTACQLYIPASQYPGDGQVALWGKFQVDTAPVTVSCVVTPWMNSTTIGPEQTLSITLPVGTNQLVGMGLVSMPGVVTGGAGGTLLTFTKTGGGTGAVSVDEAWGFGIDELSGLTIADAQSGSLASGASSNHLWIEAPTVDAPAGQVLIGTDKDQYDARWPASIQTTQVHKFPREGVSVLYVTGNATDASIDFTHYKRWTHHAAETS